MKAQEIRVLQITMSKEESKQAKLAIVAIDRCTRELIQGRPTQEDYSKLEEIANSLEELRPLAIALGIKV
jgi:hypothetical protein